MKSANLALSFFNFLFEFFGVHTQYYVYSVIVHINGLFVGMEMRHIRAGNDRDLFIRIFEY